MSSQEAFVKHLMSIVKFFFKVSSLKFPLRPNFQCFLSNFLFQRTSKLFNRRILRNNFFFCLKSESQQTKTSDFKSISSFPYRKFSLSRDTIGITSINISHSKWKFLRYKNILFNFLLIFSSLFSTSMLCVSHVFN